MFADKKLNDLGSQEPALSKSPERLVRGDKYSGRGSNEGNPMPDTGHAETTDDVMNKRDTPGRGIDEPVSPSEDNSLPFSSTGAYADGGAIPDGAADDDRTLNINDALQTVDKVMKFGYQQAGLTGGGNADQQGAIPDPSGGEAQEPAQAMADGGEVEDPQQQPQLGNPGDTGGEAIPSDGGAGVQQAAGQAGQAIQGMARPAPGGQQGVQKILRLIQGADAMPPQQAQQIEAQTGQKDPNAAKAMAIHQLAQTQGPQAAFSYLQSLRKNYDLLRTNAAVKADMGRLDLSTKSASDAMTNIVDGMDTRFQPSPDGKHVIMTTKKVGGGGATKGYDDGGEVTDDNGNDATAIPEQPQGAQGATPNTPDAQANDDAFNEGVNKIMLSLPQYYQMLRGKLGLFDHIQNSGPAAAAKEASQSPGMQPQGMGNPMDEPAATPGAASQGFIGGMKSVPDTLKGVGRAVHQYANPDEGALPPAMSAQGQGPFNQTSPWPQQGQPQQPPQAPQPQQAPQAQGVKVYSDTNPPQGNPPGQYRDQQKELEAAYGPEAVKAAQLAHPNDYAAIMAQLTGEREKQAGYTAQQANTKLIAQGRVDAAGARVQGLTTAAGIRAAVSDKNSARRAMTELQVAALRNGTAQDANIVRQMSTYAQSGTPIPDALATAAAQMIARSEGGGQVGPPQDFTKTPGAVAPVQNQKIIYINNEPWYTDGVKAIAPVNKK